MSIDLQSDERLLQEVKEHPELLQKLDPLQFERLVATLLARASWEVNNPSSKDDRGYDFTAIATVNPGLKITWLVECKTAPLARPIGVEDLRELYGAKIGKGVSNALLATTGSFTDGAKDFVQSKQDLRIINGEEITAWLRNSQPAEQHDNSSEEEGSKHPILRYFDEVRTQAARALQVWQILIGAAYNRQTITYGMLSHIVGFKGAGVWDEILGHIMHYCLRHNLPVLTVLVVNQETGQPGKGILVSSESQGDVNVERERVFQCHEQWYRMCPPSEKALGEAWRTRPGDSGSERTLTPATPHQVAMVLHKIAGTWDLDFSTGRERARITPDGDYYVDKGKQFRSVPKFKLVPLACDTELIRVEIAKNSLDGKRYDTESLRLSPTLMEGESIGRKQKLTYALVRE